MGLLYLRKASLGLRITQGLIFQSDHFVLSTNLLFKFNVSLPLVTGELLQNTIDVNNVTYKLYNINLCCTACMLLYVVYIATLCYNINLCCTVCMLHY